MRQSSRNPTLKDIAEKCGLSVPTVSRVLANKGRISDETRHVIFKTAEEIGYRPNLLVKGIQTGRTGNIGVMIKFGGVFTDIVESVTGELQKRDYLPLYAYTRQDKNGKTVGKTEQQLMLDMVDRRIDGLIMLPEYDLVEDAYFQEVWNKGIPVVSISRELVLCHADYVGTEDELGGSLAAEHLTALGHRRMAHISGSLLSPAGLRRKTGFEHVAHKANAHCITIDSTSPNYVADTMALLRSPNPPTALFCFNDTVAEEVIAVIGSCGLRVPRDVSVVGFGNGSRIMRNLTTFDQHTDEISRIAVETILARLNGTIPPGNQRKVYVAPTLLVRGSTAKV